MFFVEILLLEKCYCAEREYCLLSLRKNSGWSSFLGPVLGITYSSFHDDDGDDYEVIILDFGFKAFSFHSFQVTECSSGFTCFFILAPLFSIDKVDLLFRKSEMSFVICSCWRFC